MDYAGLINNIMTKSLKDLRIEDIPSNRILCLKQYRKMVMDGKITSIAKPTLIVEIENMINDLEYKMINE